MDKQAEQVQIIRKPRVDLNDYPPWVASEFRYNARALFLEDFWQDQEQFDEALRCVGTERTVNPTLRTAMVLAEKEPERALTFLKSAKKALDDFAAEIVPDEYLVMAVNGEQP